MTDFDSILADLRRHDDKPIPPVWTWYGLGPMLAEWLDVPPESMAAVHLQHAPFLDDELVPGEMRRRPTLVVREQYRRQLAEHGIPAAITGTIHVHFRQRAGLVPRPDAQGAVFSPTHSTHHILALLDHARMAEELAALPDRFHPVRVLLYWKDMLGGAWEPYAARGLEVVTAGHMFDDGFVPRLYRILTGTRIVLANYPQTTMMLAMEMGIPAVLFGDRPELVNMTGGDENVTVPVGTTYSYDYPPGSLIARFAAMLPDLHGDWRISEEMRAFNAEMLGADTTIEWDAVRRFVLDAHAARAARV